MSDSVYENVADTSALLKEPLIKATKPKQRAKRKGKSSTGKTIVKHSKFGDFICVCPNSTVHTYTIKDGSIAICCSCVTFDRENPPRNGHCLWWCSRVRYESID